MSVLHCLHNMHKSNRNDSKEYHGLRHALIRRTVENLETKLVRDGSTNPQIHMTSSIHQIGTMTIYVC